MYDPKKNNLLEIFGVCFILGSCITISITSLFFISDKYFPLIVYGIVLQIYFILEFTNSYLYQTNTVTSKSFLIYGNRGNKEFWFMQLLTIWEYLSVRFILKFIPFSPVNYLGFPGLILITTGLLIRHLAMKKCGLSFSHYLAKTKQAHHKLVTTGVYKYVRHPSYLGFFLFSIGIQLWLSNYLNLMVDVYILYQFFTIRIEHEEKLLIEFYQDDYLKYQQMTYTLIPFIK